jgi:hypothetical protein
VDELRGGGVLVRSRQKGGAALGDRVSGGVDE